MWCILITSGRTPWLNIDETEEKLRRALEIAKEYEINLMVPAFTPKKSFCRHPFDHFLVRWDGVVVSCVGHRFLLGDINSDSPEKIWNSVTWQDLRRRIAKEGYRNVCPDCQTWQANRKDLLLNATPNLGQQTIDLRTEDNNG